MQNIFPTAYLPPTSYLKEMIGSIHQGNDIYIEVCETYEKQTYRNRCNFINSNNEKMNLSIPVITRHGQKTKDVQIAYYQPWQRQHWQMLSTLYNTTPYFMYYSDFFRPFYYNRYKWLVDFNMEILQTIIDLLFNQFPKGSSSIRKTQTWNSIIWTDTHFWQKETSVVANLFEYGPLLISTWKI